jgi:hypothetical protein
MTDIDQIAKGEIAGAKRAAKKKDWTSDVGGGYTKYPDDKNMLNLPKRMSESVARSNARAAGGYRKARRGGKKR